MLVPPVAAMRAGKPSRLKALKRRLLRKANLYPKLLFATPLTLSTRLFKGRTANLDMVEVVAAVSNARGLGTEVVLLNDNRDNNHQSQNSYKED